MAKLMKSHRNFFFVLPEEETKFTIKTIANTRRSERYVDLRKVKMLDNIISKMKMRSVLFLKLPINIAGKANNNCPEIVDELSDKPAVENSELYVVTPSKYPTIWPATVIRITHLARKRSFSSVSKLRIVKLAANIKTFTIKNNFKANTRAINGKGLQTADIIPYRDSRSKGTKNLQYSTPELKKL